MDLSRLHGVNSLVQLMRSRYRVTSCDQALHFDKLEEDVVLTFIVGKPLIDTPSHLRKVFQFKMEKQEQKG